MAWQQPQPTAASALAVADGRQVAVATAVGVAWWNTQRGPTAPSVHLPPAEYEAAHRPATAGLAVA